MKTVRVQNNVAVEVMTPVEGFALEDCFHPLLIAQCEQVEDEVQVGWVKQEDGTWVAPAEPEVQA